MSELREKSKVSDRFNTFLIFGAPGSGKGTQGQALGMIPRFHHCACGDVFRSLDTRTELGQEFVAYSARGELVPDDITVQLWRAQIESQVDIHEFKPDIDFLVLDGIPRNAGQAQFIEPYVNVHQVFHLSCPNRDELRRRLRKRALKDNRIDDASDKVIDKRLATYEEESKSILSHYPADIITDINAAQPPAKVLHEILSVILELKVWKEAPHLW
jgi:adenylate kinase